MRKMNRARDRCLSKITASLDAYLVAADASGVLPTYEGWIKSLHPENVSSYGLDRRFLLPSCPHRQLFVEKLTERRNLELEFAAVGGGAGSGSGAGVPACVRAGVRAGAGAGAANGARGVFSNVSNVSKVVGVGGVELREGHFEIVEDRAAEAWVTRTDEETRPSMTDDLQFNWFRIGG